MHRVSFGKYLMRTDDGQYRPATFAEIQKLFIDSRNDNNERIYQQRQQMEQILKKEHNLLKQILLKEFFNEIIKLQNRYEEEYDAQMKAISSNPDNHICIRVDPQGGYHGHGVGDNCFEYAMNDFYECRLLGFSPYARETHWIPSVVRAKLPLFLNPGFTYEWPLFVNDSESWSIKYRHRLLSREGFKQMLYQDAAAFGITCKEISYDPDRYVAPEGTILLCAVLGYRTSASRPYDYHFYRYHPRAKLWSHKPGTTPVTCFDKHDNLIITPTACAHSYPRTEIVGFFQYTLPG